jgi:hypothetical protein
VTFVERSNVSSINYQGAILILEPVEQSVKWGHFKCGSVRGLHFLNCFGRMVEWSAFLANHS